MKTIAIALAATALGTAAHAETVLRFTDYGPNRGARAAALEWFADELSSRTDGEVALEFFWGGSLVGGRDTLGALAAGVADMGTIVGFFTPQELRLYSIGDLPVEADRRTGMRAMYDLARSDALSAEFDAAGVRYVTNYTTGPIQLICREPLESLDAIDGLKIRASGPYGDTLASLGAEVVRMSQGDVYQALDSGLLDCNQNYYYAMLAYKQYEVAPHVAELDWGQNMAFGIAMNPASHDMLSEEHRAVLDRLGSDFVDELARRMEAADAEAKRQMEAGIDGAAITVTPLSDADRARLTEASQATIDAWAERVGEGADEVREAYDAAIETAG